MLIRVAADDEIKEGAITGVDAEGQDVVLVRVKGEVFAVEGLCNHALAYLSDGDMEGYDLICPLHSGAFDVRNGAPTRAPCVEAIKTYPVKIEGREVFIAID